MQTIICLKHSNTTAINGCHPTIDMQAEGTNPPGPSYIYPEFGNILATTSDAVPHLGDYHIMLIFLF